MITMSALQRLLNCTASAVLPKAENHNEWADRGNDDHAELAAQLKSGDLPEWIAAVMPPNPMSEVAVAYDVTACVGRIIGTDLGRAYGNLGPFEIPGSIDVLGVDGDTVVIVDFKTGFADVDPASSNAQLWGYALAACRALGHDRAIVRIVYTQTGVVDAYAIDALELAEFAVSLEKLHIEVAHRQAARKRGEVLETREGSWCKHCASKHVCPSKVGLLTQVATNGLAVIGETEMTPERAIAAYGQIVRVESLLKDARKRLETYVDETGPIDLGGGRAFGRYMRKGNEKLDGATAVRAIRDVVGEQASEFEAMAVVPTVTKAAIERAAKQLVASGAPKLAKAVIARVRDLGGVTSTPTTPIGEYQRDKDEPASFDRASMTEEANRLLAGGES